MRDRFVLVLALGLILATSLSVFVGGAAVVESQIFAQVFTASSLRLITVFGLVLFVVFFIRRSFEARDIEYLLSRPISRIQFVLSYAVAFAVLSCVMSAVVGLCYIMTGGDILTTGAQLWIVSILVETILMTFVALFFAMVLGSAVTAAMAAFGFYILARMMGQILGIIDASSQGPLMGTLETLMQGISVFIPRLDLMGQSAWLVYGVPEDGIGLLEILAQGTLFSVVILSATFIDLKRKSF